MAMIGMDIEQVRQLATQFGVKADAINDIITDINSRLGSTEWRGQDAEQFRNDWNSSLTTQLRNVSQALRDAQTTANRNADEQDRVASTL